MSHQHIVSSFGEELDQLRAEVVQLGGLAEALVADAVASVARRDAALAAQVVQRDRKLDELQADIERKALRLIALRQPMAADLRQTVAALKISLSLERVGDMAKGIAKRVDVLAEAEGMTKLARSFERMGKLVQTRLKEVLDAYARSETPGLMNVWAHDDEIDDHYESMFRELLTYMMGDARMIGAGANLLFMAKNLERIGDHATNIAEMAHYEITGVEIEGDRPKGEPVKG
ncbi:MAG TPA: phosphate signaling complex protein PhoU [Caulobacteraceae bacterium]|nr:phosphate signaling complex protein PhoU [Caulobacteraceae bacterium]